MITNCHNCGAVLKNGKCEYCGTNTEQSISTSEVEKYLNGGYKKLYDDIDKAMDNGTIELRHGMQMKVSLGSKITN